MPDFLKSALTEGPAVSPVVVLWRLLLALALGLVVAWIYRRTRQGSDISVSFPVTLVLLSVLIAMVTQVIGDNVARAFSLVGALSIVRFRTVVRDTQDTAYVIFAVVVGMAVGAQDLWVAVLGLVVVGAAAFLMMGRFRTFAAVQWPFNLSVRVGLGHDPDQLLKSTLDERLLEHELMSVSAGKQGLSLDVCYRCRLRPGRSAEELVKALNLIEGVQRVQFHRRDLEED